MNHIICSCIPDIVARLAQSSSESELDSQLGAANISTDVFLMEQKVEINFNEHLLAFQDTVPRYMKNKKSRRQRKKSKKDGESLCSFYRVIILFEHILN